MTGRRFFVSTVKAKSLGFITSWRTTNTSTGSSLSNQIKLPLVNTGSYVFNVDWGDTTTDYITAWNQTEVTHTYGSSGDYIVTITGTCTAWSFNNTGDRLKIMSVVSWGNTGFSNLVNGFYGCANLSSISGNFVYYGTSLSQIFRNCSLTSIPSGLLDNCTAVTSLLFAFDNNSITSIPYGLLDNCTAATNFAQVFRQNPITSIPSGLFDNNTVVTSFAQAFNLCPITSIPTGLFDNCTSVTNFDQTFRQTAITSIPTGLFDNCTSVTNFFATFFQAPITSIPTGLFDNNTSVTSFAQTFHECPITSIPSGLFDNCTAVTNFNGTFRQTAITSIPTGLFDNCTSVTNFFATFQGTPITSIPTDLFDNCPSVISFAQTFSNCVNLPVSVSFLVSGMTMNSCTTTNQMFSGCTSITGNGADLIAKPKAAGYTVGTGALTGSYRTFYLCTSLIDYATIPADYK